MIFTLIAIVAGWGFFVSNNLALFHLTENAGVLL